MKKILYSSIVYIFYLNALFSSLPYTGIEKSIVVLIPSYNNKKWYKTNLDSVLNQTYSNYRVIYTDDCSPDGTGDLVEQYIKERCQEHRVTLIKNKKRRRALANMYTMIHMCNDNEIIAIVDGDDWLAHNNVFTYINNLYENSNVWMSYGQYRIMPLGAISSAQPFPQECVKNNAYRSHSWRFGQLCTYYAWLAQHIKLEDCLSPDAPYCGKFFPAGYDNVTLHPIIEMTGGKYACVSEVLYIRNILNPLNNFKVNHTLQFRVRTTICTRYLPYNPLNQPCMRNLKALQQEQADVVLVTTPNQDAIPALNALRAQVTGAHAYYTITDTTQSTIKQQLEAILTDQSQSKYILLTNSEYIAQKPIHIGACIQALEQTFAYGFYLGKSKEQGMPPHTSLNTTIGVWQFKNDTNNWCSPLNLEATLYRKQDILHALQNLTCTTVQELYAQLPKVTVNNRKIGLFYKDSIIK